MNLNEENYRSPEAEMKYMTFSQFSNFMDCEAQALAMVKGTWELESTTALLVGLFVEAHFEGRLNLFKSQHPEILTLKGELRSEFKLAEKMIERCEKDPIFMEYLQGDHQTIFTGEICGVPVKAKIDIYDPTKYINDLKTVKDFELQWDGKTKVPFIESRRYDIQAFFYTELEKQYRDSNVSLPYHIVAVTKEKEPDIEVFKIPNERIKAVGNIVYNLIERYADIKEGKIVPERCEHCDYCKRTKKLIGPVNYLEKRW